MRDILGWDCEEGCNCEQEGHVHHNDPRVRPKVKNKPWWQIF